MEDKATTSAPTDMDEPLNKESSDMEAETAEGGEKQNEAYSEELELKSRLKLDDLPEEAKKYAKQVEKDFKSAFTKKMQEIKSRDRAREYELAKLQADLQQTRDLLKAYTEKSAEPENTTDFKTVDDLVRWHQKELQRTREITAAEAKKEAQRLVEQYKADVAWELALERKAAKDADFRRYQNLITDHIIANVNKYRQMYTGENIEEILEYAKEDVLGLIEPAVQEKSKQASKLAEKKKQASILAGGSRAGGSVSGSEKKDPESIKRAIIDRINAKHGPNTLLERYRYGVG